jgi:hypothetical protein
MFRDPAHDACIRINGLLTFTLEFERITLINLIKSVFFSLIHGVPPMFFVAPDIGRYRGLYKYMRFFPAA